MKKHIAKLALLLAIALVIGVVAGCDNTPDATDATTTAATTTAAGETTTADAFPNLNPPGQLPVVKEAETLRLLLAASPHILSYEYGENAFTTYLQDRSGVEIEFIQFAEADAKTKLNLELSTNGDLGDLFLMTGSNQLDKSALITYGSQGVLMDITELLNTYCINITTDLDATTGAWGAITAPDDGIYAFPRGSQSFLSPNEYAMRHWIHSDFLAAYTDATGMEMPTTTDEYYEFLVWVRDNDVNGNGDTTDEVGWTGAENRSVWYARPTDFLMNSFSFQNKDGYYQRDDTIHAAFVEDDYREGLKYLNMLMEEGLMDENYVNNDENGMKSLVALEDGYTVASGSWGGMHNAATDHRIRNLYEIVAPLEGPDGFQNAYYSHYESLSAPGAISIATSSEKPELAAAWVDSCFDMETRMRGRYGELGVDWVVPPEGTVAVDGGPALYRDINNQWNVPTYSHWFTSNPSLIMYAGSMSAEPQPAYKEDGSPIHDLELSLYNAARLYENYVIPCAVPDFFFDAETATKASEWKQTIDDLYRAGVTEFIFGTSDIDSDADWEAYVAELEEAGLTEYLAAMQAEYDRVWVGTMPAVYTPHAQRT